MTGGRIDATSVWHDPPSLIGYLEHMRRRGRVSHVVAAAFSNEGAIGLVGGSHNLQPVLHGLDRLVRKLDRGSPRPLFPDAVPVVIQGDPAGGRDVYDVLLDLMGMQGRGEILQLAVLTSGSGGPWYDVAGPVQPDSASFVRHLRRELEARDGFREGQVLQVRWPVVHPPASLREFFD